MAPSKFSGQVNEHWLGSQAGSLASGMRELKTCPRAGYIRLQELLAVLRAGGRIG